MLHQRIGIFTALPIRSLNQLSLQQRLKEIGRMHGATARVFQPRTPSRMVEYRPAGVRRTTPSHRPSAAPILLFLPLNERASARGC